MTPADESEVLHSFAPSQPACVEQARRVFDVLECLMSAAGVHRAERKRREGKRAAAEMCCLFKWTKEEQKGQTHLH